MCEYCNINGDKKEFITKEFDSCNIPCTMNSYISLAIENDKIVPVYTDIINFYRRINSDCNIVISRPIKFCPMCGQNLEDLIDSLSSNDPSEEEN